MPSLSIPLILTKRTSRPALIIGFVALVLLSLTFFLTPHAYEQVNSITTIISTHASFEDVVPPLQPEGEERTKIDAGVAAPPPQRHLANATLFMLARNSDVDSAVHSVREMEDRFNHNYGYPWVFLNEEPFSEDFIRCAPKPPSFLSKARHAAPALADLTVFPLDPYEHWYQPDWINETIAAAERDRMVQITSYTPAVYRNMCRFNSGFFYRHPLVQNYRYYWRVEPGVHFHCDVNIDPFVYLHENNKTYGFTISLYEYQRTIESLWSTVHEFMAEHPEYVAQNNAMPFLSDNGGSSYNLCHFWSNFEIADMDFWRGEAYSAFFEYLDSRGGFYYERWGDAPVHSIAAALFAGKDRIHFFREIGYDHAPFMHCPTEQDIWEQGRCACNSELSFDYHLYSCLWKWDRLFIEDRLFGDDARKGG
ncbi:nucleotide-diphospho-sugar transferase [Russula vinacea]|nr:nucleotide-diphospho-sugar transferase [Russula vinacea]